MKPLLGASEAKLSLIPKMFRRARGDNYPQADVYTSRTGEIVRVTVDLAIRVAALEAHDKLVAKRLRKVL
jgi:hypothetical protein